MYHFLAAPKGFFDDAAAASKAYEAHAGPGSGRGVSYRWALGFKYYRPDRSIINIQPGHTLSLMEGVLHNHMPRDRLTIRAEHDTCACTGMPKT